MEQVFAQTAVLLSACSLARAPPRVLCILHVKCILCSARCVSNAPKPPECKPEDVCVCRSFLLVQLSLALPPVHAGFEHSRACKPALKTSATEAPEQDFAGVQAALGTRSLSCSKTCRCAQECCMGQAGSLVLQTQGCALALSTPVPGLQHTLGRPGFSQV